MSHERKKDEERKDKKNERMREDVADRKASAAPESSRDQKDGYRVKPGHPGDQMADPTNKGQQRGQ